jgi:hypothetical protein
MQAEKQTSGIKVIHPEEDANLAEIMQGTIVLLAGIFGLLMIITMIKVMRR